MAGVSWAVWAEQRERREREEISGEGRERREREFVPLWVQRRNQRRNHGIGEKIKIIIMHTH